MWGFHDGMGWWMVFGGVWMLAFWAVMVGLLIWGVTKVAGNRPGRSDSDETPLDIARMRLAKGEITREEFDELTGALS